MENPKESWRGDFKGINQVAGWMGKGKDTSREDALEHRSTPISALKDPSSFGPPPKSVKYHGSAALPPPTDSSSQPKSDTGGLGAPIPQSEIRAQEEAEEAERRRQEEEASKPKPPPIPYRANTTGLSVAHLPPPPGRKRWSRWQDTTSYFYRCPAPSAPSPPPTYGAATSGDPQRGVLNQGALDRLGAAGISVPGFGIGSTKSKPALPPPPTRSSTNSSPPPPPARTSSPQLPPRTSSPQIPPRTSSPQIPPRTSSPQIPPRTSSPQIPSRTSSPQLSELQSRFSKLTTSPNPPNSTSNPPPPTSGTTFAQKQAALKTASAFHKDPTSISLAEARTAASTANNFRERHGEQVKSGWASANKINTKYGIADKVETGSTAAAEEEVGVGGVGGSGGGGLGNDTPPPIPMATKPKPR
ncbi:hypothetical protein EYC84_007393 [Monilinia fructicola]|uniref:Uncharacterized protein n=1 Tax=Monilinia fructicola TaxID=38448 RepID=A0A5M9JI01_MONFR|nr:hypothetical protein EYC84_007393 [Monilinia fructicola]